MSKPIANINETKAIIQKYGFSFQKRFGQNFLIDRNTIENILDGAGITEEDVVLEVGPGIGSLTQAMAERAKKVIAVEIDKKLIPMLSETLEEYNNIRIINEDILKLDIKAVLEEEGIDQVKVVANLPYYITTPIIMNLLEQSIPVESITVMIQKEVADRMNAKPGVKSYGSLSLATAYYAETELVTLVAPGCFIPQPKVGSAVIKLTKRLAPPVEVADEQLMFKIIRGSFAQRRKTMVNSLFNSNATNLTKESILEALEALQMDSRIRGEALTLEEFAAFTNEVIS